jgi:H+/gluconate symporter-like permease
MKYGACMFRATPSIVSAISSFVAKSRQTMHHVSASPPFHPGRSDFPSPVGDLDHSHFSLWDLPMLAPAVKNVIGIWALIIAVTGGIVLTVALEYKNLPKKDGLQKAINAGAIGSLLAIMNTASEVGYGNVIAALPGFKTIANAVLGIQLGGTPLVSEAIGVTTLAGITGSASGGLAISPDLMAKDWLSWANSIGLSPEILHRVASMSSGGMDTPAP